MKTRTERQEERLSIINTLVGNIESYGETNIDNEAIKNIDFAYDVLYLILKQFINNILYDGNEESRLKIREKSLKILKSLKEDIDDLKEVSP